MGRSKAIPDRWLDYSDVGGIVPGTRFIAFKVPLRESICSRMPPNRRFTPDQLLQRIYDLGLVIDLTCTDRYYDPGSLVSRGVIHAKIMCAGQQIPSAGVVSDFFRAVDAFVMDPANDGKLIGVHCTHGVNRTGYLVCKYMIEKLSIAPTTAIEEFQNARGHRFDREEYVDDLQRVDRPEYPSEFRRFDGQYVSSFQGADRQGHVRNLRGVGSPSSEPLAGAARAPSGYDGYGDYSFNSQLASSVQTGERSGWRHAAPSGDGPRSYGYFGGMQSQLSGLGMRLPGPAQPHFWQANGPVAASNDELYSVRVPYRPHTHGDTGHWRPS